MSLSLSSLQKQQGMPLSGMRQIYGIHKKQVTTFGISSITTDSILLLIVNIKVKHSFSLYCLAQAGQLNKPLKEENAAISPPCTLIEECVNYQMH